MVVTKGRTEKLLWTSGLKPHYLKQRTGVGRREGRRLLVIIDGTDIVNLFTSLTFTSQKVNTKALLEIL